jgi:CMP-N,N'-diacetyllegionaminic acid synthase
MSISSKQRLLGFIPARSGSVRAPNKNVRPIGGGTTPIWRAVTAALAADSLDAIVVSTDSTDYLHEAAAAGAATEYRRPPHLATSDATIADSVADYLAWSHMRGQGGFSHIVLLQPTSLFRTAADIDDAVLLWQESGCRSLVSVRPAAKLPALLVWGSKRQSSIARAAKRPTLDDDKQPYVLNGAIYITPVEDIICRGQWWDERSVYYVCDTPDPYDIDTESDLAAAEALLNCGHKLSHD